MNFLNLTERLVYVVMNILFFVLGGFLVCFWYIVGGLFLCATIIGIPAGYECFKIGVSCLAPFGKSVEARDESTAKGIASLICNVIWIPFIGIWLALQHLLCGLFFYITIVGIPFGNKHFQLMSLSFAPFGRRLVSDYEFDD